MATEAALEAAKKFLLEKCPGFWTGGVGAFQYFDAKGGGGGGVHSCACHANLKGHSGNPSAMVFVQRKSFRTHEKQGRAFVKWMCTQGPGSPFVLNKNDIDECCDKGIIFDTECSGRKMAYWFAKTLRYTSEEPSRCFIWYELVNEYKIHPLTAFIACSVYGKAWTWSGNTHAACIPNPRTIDDLREALTKTWPVEPRPFVEATDSYNMFWNCPKENYYFGMSGKLFPYASQKQVKVEDGWGGYTYQTVGTKKEDIAEELKRLTKEALQSKPKEKPLEKERSRRPKACRA